MSVFEQPLLEQLETRSGTSLVLSGGATKAFYFHIGVLKALHLHNQDITSIVGSSAGAVLGAMIASGIDIDTLHDGVFQDELYLPELERWVKTVTTSTLFRPRFGGILRQGVATGIASAKLLLSLPLLVGRDILAEVLDTLANSQSQVSSFFSAAELEQMVFGLLDEHSFGDMQTDLYVTATDIDSNRRAVFNARYTGIDDHNRFYDDVPVPTAVRASVSVPGLFEPVKIHGRYYVDGEIKRTLSADIGIHLSDTVIVSHTYQPLKRPGGRSVKNMGYLSILKQSLYVIFYERIRIWKEIYEERYPDKRIIMIMPRPDDEFFFRAPQFTFKPEIVRALIQSGEEAARYALTDYRDTHDDIDDIDDVLAPIYR